MKFSRLGDGSFFAGGFTAYGFAAIDAGRKINGWFFLALGFALFIWAQWDKK